MILVEPFCPEHLAQIRPQAAQRELAGDLIDLGCSLSATGRCFTARRSCDGAIVFCGGALEAHRHYATLWAVLAEDAGSILLALTRRVAMFIGALGHRRIDCAVRIDHEEGHRWARRLGFVAEREAGEYFEDGGDAMIYRWRGSAR